MAIRCVVFFKASLPTIRLLDACWQRTLHDFEQKGSATTLKYVQEHILQISDCGEFWSSGWASGLWASPTGHGPHTYRQSLQRFNGTIKSAMPAGYHLLSLCDMIKNLDQVNGDLLIERGFVDAKDETRVLFKATDPSTPCQKLLTADRLKPGRDEMMEQTCLAPVWRFLECLPDNVASSTLNRASPHALEAVQSQHRSRLPPQIPLLVMTAHDAASCAWNIPMRFPCFMSLPGKMTGMRMAAWAGGFVALQQWFVG